MNPQTSLSSRERSQLVAELVKIARGAGELLLHHYSDNTTVREKADRSPVTIADEVAEEHILRHLRELLPDFPVIAEESVAAGRIPDLHNGSFFLVDPLDGTKEFLNKNGEFTVNIALVENATPILGVVYAPAINRMFFGDGSTAYEVGANSSQARTINTRIAPTEGMTAIASRSHRDRLTEEYLSHYPIANFLTAGSSLKFCVLAAGEADIYPRHGTTMEWDTAAGDAVLRSAGGRVTRLDGRTMLTYGNAAEKFTNPSFIAWGK